MKSKILLLTLLSPVVIISAQNIGTSPIPYNPERFFNTFKTMTDYGAPKDIYPLGSQDYYIHDTVTIPFIDDFSTYRFKNYDMWSLGTPVDSVAPKYRITPLPPSFPMSYCITPTYSFSITSITPPQIDSVINTAYLYTTYGNPLNPFIPVDSYTIWPVITKRYFFNTLTSTIDSSSYYPDGIITDDSTSIFHVYFPPANDNALWIDNYAYRNFSMGVHPPTLGVVTLDGTNEFGKAYQPGVTGSYGINDYLTSKPIDLNFPASDSIYLSFFYQPQGLGYAPAAKDSLVLEFYDVDNSSWHHVLNIPGANMHAFKQRIVPITDTRFLKKGFQFRFKNWGNRSGNLDHWNLDYIRLDKSRNHADTLIADVAFVYPPFSILRRYREMPFTQFTQSEVDSKWENYMRNLDTLTKEICYKFVFYDQNWNVLNRYTEDYMPVPSDTNYIAPYITSGYASYSRFIQPDFNYNFQSSAWLPLTDSTSFYVKNHIIQFDTDVRAENDTFLLKQNFYSHYAYDDGTAEESIWLGTLGSMALKFRLNFPDTLRAIQFYFNPVREDESSRFIDLRVWTSLTDPQPLYSESRQIRILPDDPTAHLNPVNNGFSTYILENPVPLPVGDFYVGWYQNQSFKIHLGFDKNTNNSGYTFYKTTNQWDTLSLSGTPMIRPVVGPAISKAQIGIEDINSPPLIRIYPNPASDMLFFDIPASTPLHAILLTDISGKSIISKLWNGDNYLSVQGFAPGIYLLHFFDHNGAKHATHKLILQ